MRGNALKLASGYEATKTKLLKIMEHYSYAFEKLEVWRKGKELVKMVYRFTGQFPKDEQAGLARQMRRAAVSLISNIAEGTSRQTSKDRSHFSVIAYSSLMELVNQTILALELEYLEDSEYQNFRALSTEVSRMLYALRNAQKKLE